MKHILITNDDGYDSVGIKALVEGLREIAHVTVVAPSLNKSACAHSLTLKSPLRFIQVDDDYYKLDDGTPSDCIYLAMNALFDTLKPDLVVSGINYGSNMGEDITYSGTVGGAMEGVLQGVPALSVSQVFNDMSIDAYPHDYALAVDITKKIAKKILEEGFPLKERRLLNINVPNVGIEEYHGALFTHAGHRLYGNDAHMHRNPRAEEYYWIGLHPLEYREKHHDLVSDFEAIEHGFVSITPVKLDLTSYKDIGRLKSWL